MTFRVRYGLAAALGLCVAHPFVASAAEPPPNQPPARLHIQPGDALPSAAASPAQNQKLADTVADLLRQSGQLRGYTIDVAVRNGVVQVLGSVADQPQREEVLRLVQGVPGVERVIDRMTVADAVARARAEAPPPGLPEPVAPRVEPVPAPLPPPPGNLPPPAVGGPPAEPMPIFQPPAPSPYDLNPPKMPPYAWPTYAPYNNYSRVAYPLAYPYQSWPFIGPCYPFPKVPLGWRSVKLEWDDGYWWFSKTATKYDWWHLRYW